MCIRDRDKRKAVKDINVSYKKKDNYKQLEYKLRRYNFQQEILDMEEARRLKFNNINSRASLRLLEALIDHPKIIMTPKPIPPQEYLKYL
eukprot:TRINITY_DN7138_c0_g1_i1.p2 TRINITY_DN7138_c0_g1~~TRINITY_DN7138_c0_g1_i1.p2  ORF type:complete len:101 (-),score=11.64 TRINITY_DN7138_c0_g1_i1:277-546(-)